MKILRLILDDNNYIFGDYLLKYNKVASVAKHFVINNVIRKKLTAWGNFELDPVFVFYLLKELVLSEFYRKCFIGYNYNLNKFLRILLIPTKCDLIDYEWNRRVYQMVREKCELDHALSWLSTLGGAFSALGDYYLDCATMAGKISAQQLQLAIRLHDPQIISRCKLYFSLSLIQKGKFRAARKIVLHEFYRAKTAPVVDERLIRMCKGIWAKLQYEICRNKEINQ